MRKQNAGFTLIELVMVIVILGILAASFAPKFVDLGGAATTAAQDSARGTVKSALTVSIAEQQGYPTVAQLAANVEGGAASAGNDSIDVTIDGAAYSVATFKTEPACTTPTAAATDIVCATQL